MTSKARGLDLKRKIFDFFTTIRFKLMISFSIPIIFIIILGVVSYRNASEGIISKYEMAAGQAVYMASDYLSFGLENVDATVVQLLNDESVKKYLWGLYDDDIITKNTIKTNLKSSILAKQMTDSFISNIYILSKKQEPVSTGKEITIENGYNGLWDNSIGEIINKHKAKSIWIGSQLKNITDNVDNIENARESTLGAIENISAVLEEIAASTNSVNQVSDQQLEAVESLNQSAKTLNSNSEKQVQALKKFTI